ncbi:MAG: hypothetical protein KBG39_11320 [Opitutaceae bacterium]|nr:hypothetical protein [Opitutaceae bacterium]MBP8963523.1 hypothetical protein [Opitutaceae bacterium]
MAWLGPVPARFASGVSLSRLVLAWTALTSRSVGATRSRESWVIGGLWTVLAVAFEFGFGRLVAHQSWKALLRAYTFQGGDIWPLVLLCIAASPALALRWRRPFAHFAEDRGKGIRTFGCKKVRECSVE